MKKLFTYFSLCVNILNYVLCDLYALGSLKMDSFFQGLNDAYKSTVSNTPEQRFNDMKHFDNVLSCGSLLFLSIPFGLFFAFLLRQFFDAEALLLFFFAETMLSILLFMSVDVCRPKEYSLKALDAFRTEKLGKWRHAVILFVAFDVVLGIVSYHLLIGFNL